MEQKMNFGKVKSGLENNNLRSILNKDKESDWDYYDSPLYDIGYSFAEVLPYEYVKKLKEDILSTFEDYGEPFKKYIESTLSKNKEPRTAVEFGGSGSSFFSDFSKGFFTKTVGVCLEDIRRPEVKELDGYKGHSVVEVNIFDVKNKYVNGEITKPYEKITEALGQEKVDLIVSRMIGPLSGFSKDPLILDSVIRKWYKMLNKNGIIFAQFKFSYKHMADEDSKRISETIPEPFKVSEVNVKEWVIAMEKKFSEEEIDIQLDRGVIRIHKKENAPDELPTLKELFK